MPSLPSFPHTQPRRPPRTHSFLSRVTSPDLPRPIPPGSSPSPAAATTSSSPSAAPVGGESKVWGPERHPQVTVVNGLLNALLGFENTLASQPNFFRPPLYVGITIDADGNPNTADLELVPRQVLLPAGWALCDGANGTPDLRNRFVMGHPDDGDTTAGQTGGTGTHPHRVNGSTSTRSATAGVAAIRNANNDWFTEGHAHSFDVTSASTSHLPPYRVLAYIMKL